MKDPRPVNDVVSEYGVAAAINMKHVASLLFTYKCTIKCKHCCFNCGPEKESSYTDFDHAIRYLRQLHKTDRVIHIAGGEAMMFYPQMREICKAAANEGIAPHFIETNASFASNDELTYGRLKELKSMDVGGLLVSADAFHQEFVQPEFYHRCYNIAVDVFGKENVIGADLTFDELYELRAISADKNKISEYALKYIPMLVGRAGDCLAEHFPGKPVDQLLDSMWHGGENTVDCSLEFNPDTMWELHIDPYGNIQTCCGIILGNANQTPLPDLIKTGFLGRSKIIDAVYNEGPAGLLSIAIEYGYVPKENYPQKCGLCWEVKKYLKQYFPESIGPDEIYVNDL